MVDLYHTILSAPEYFKPIYCDDLLFTRYDCPQQSRFQDLYCEQNSITYVISGKRTFYLPGRTIDMTAGKCVFLKKGAWIAEKEDGMGWCVLVFIMPDDFLRQFVREQRASLPKVASAESTEQLLDLHVNETTRCFFNSMVPYFSQTPQAPVKQVELKFRELLFTILTNSKNNRLLAWASQLADSNRVPLQTVMEANYTFNLSLKQFARISGRSLASFKREFAEIYKTSPGKWLLRRRLQYANLLLSTTQKGVNEIAFESGFQNAAHFSKQFKRSFGHTPSSQRSASLAT